ncbi:hypothetical protein NEOLEDRAFT_1180544 [Neolentinus lepideus HHB14362 ss-1]|uniref:Aspartic peptidase DDI1-type domain-containing protein n=1 Tax=Neolentinus lepideus HHB14362 ss-1 TaxID=1314782 RepID=A0A165QWF4_9AGAM|nr:hypothetical protein NEOLEDRAFT_1180544 [Neolentinus lepideus HHB14362 ss-1]
MVPRYIIGAMMCERIQEWHRQNPNQCAAGILSVQDDRAAYILNADERIEYLYREILALDGARKRPVFDGVHVPPRPRHADVENRSQGSQPPGLPEVGEQQPSATTSEPAVNRSSPSPATSTLRDPPLHPFNRAKDIVWPRQAAPKTIRPDPVPETEAKKREPAYKTQAPVYNPQLTEDIFKRSLTSTCVSLSPEELLAISPDVRSKYREIVTPKKVPTPNRVQFSATIEEIEDEEAPILVLEEQVSPTTALSDGYVVPDPYDTYLKSLSPEEAPEPLVVAKESHAIQSIIAVVAHVEQVECIIDPGCQIIAMSEAVCHSIGLEYDPRIQLRMQSVNRSIDMSLGLARNVPFQLGDVVLYLQVHVIHDPAYDILLGRPFDVITESLVWNFSNEEQTITIRDPNSDAVATIPTFLRGRLKFRPFPYNDH